MSNSLCMLYIVTTDLILFAFSLYFARTLKSPWTCYFTYLILGTINVLLIFSLSVGSIFWDVPHNGQHYLFCMTPLQEWVLFLVSAQYCIDYALWLSGINVGLEENSFVWHHPLALIGVLYQVYFQIGGGLMVRLLLDSITCLLAFLEKLVLTVIPKRQKSIYLYFYILQSISHWTSRYDYHKQHNGQ